MKIKDHSPRMALNGDHLERTFRISDFSQDMRGRGAEVCSLLNDCLPLGASRDIIGATSKQIAYILTLADLKGKEIDDFFDIVSCSGGLSSYQAHYLIQKLKGE